MDSFKSYLGSLFLKSFSFEKKKKGRKQKVLLTLVPNAPHLSTTAPGGCGLEGILSLTPAADWMGGHWSWDVEIWGRCSTHLISTEAWLDARQECSFTCRASSALLCWDNSTRFGSIGTSPVCQRSSRLSTVQSLSAVFISINGIHHCQHSSSPLYQHKSSLSIPIISINTDHLQHSNTSPCVKLISVNIADHYRYNPFCPPACLSHTTLGDASVLTQWLLCE